MQSVIITFDSLATGALGCYGNEWVETPNWDRLAATGAVFDLHFASTLGLSSGLAETPPAAAVAADGSAVGINARALLSSSAIATRLIVAGEIRSGQQGLRFDDIQSVSGIDGFEANPAETSFAHVIKAGIAAWQDPAFQKRPRLLWLHASGPGDAPRGFDELYFEDFEERGQSTSELTDEERKRHPAVYAGAVSLLDHWLGELLAEIERTDTGDPTLIIVAAARGDRWQPVTMSRPHDAQCHVQALGDQVARTPLVLRVQGDARFKDLTCLRCDRFVQTSDLVSTLVDWFSLSEGVADSPHTSLLRELTEENARRTSLHYDDGARYQAIRTEDWLCIRERETSASTGRPDPENSGSVALFVKPEDVWEINNVASQHPEIVAEFGARFLG
jgi:arylsulfatase A-like enzyme